MMLEQSPLGEVTEAVADPTKELIQQFGPLWIVIIIGMLIVLLGWAVPKMVRAFRGKE